MVQLKINFVSDSHLLAKYICFIAKGIQINKYSQGNYLILPYSTPKKFKSVHFPNLNYSPKFWSEIEKLSDYSLTQTYPQYCLDEVISKLPSPQPESSILQNQWDKNFLEYQKHLNAIFSPVLLKQIGDIDILLTQYGTPGSFSRSRPSHKPLKLVCTARTDYGPENILQILVNCLITITQPSNADVGTIGWYERNAIINYIAKHSSISPILPQYKDDIPNEKLIRESQCYLETLGFPKTNSFTLNSLQQYLTPQESRLLKKLVDNSGQMVTFDQAAQSIWEDQTDEKFSLYALAKIIESLRAKIKSHGIYRQLIHTKRKQGYLFLN